MKTLTTSEAAERLGITRKRVAKLIAAGSLTATLEPFGPGTRYLVDAKSVAARKRAMDAGEIKAGRPVAKPAPEPPAKVPARRMAAKRKGK